MDLRVREAARLLSVTEGDVHSWIRDGSLPATRVGRQYRLNRVDLQEWAATHGRRVSPELFGASPTVTLPSLADALAQGGVHRNVPGNRREDVLDAATRLPGIPEDLDRVLLHQLLIAREAMAPTCVGRGVALPHPRDPVVMHVREPRVLLCFLKERVDFGALDGEPVRTLFLLFSTSVRVHLALLARLAHALHDDVLRQLLSAQGCSDTIQERIRAIEEGKAHP